MSDQNFSNTTVLSARDESAKTSAIIGYALLIAGAFTGVFWFIGGIWALIKRSDAHGSIFEDHYRNQVKTFIGFLLMVLLGWVCFITIIGIPLAIIIWVVNWVVTAYRLLKGILRLMSNRPYYTG